MLHRPGPELKRLTPRNNDRLLFDGIPWVARAQDEHDAFAAALRERGRRGALPDGPAHRDARRRRGPRPRDRRPRWAACTSARRCGAGSARCSTSRRPAELATHLTAGVRNDEVRGGFGLVTSLLPTDDFLIDPLPNLLFTRDSSVWVRDRVTITSLAMPARARETQLTELIYTLHPRFAGTTRAPRLAQRARRGRRRPPARARRARHRRRRAHDAGRRRAARPRGVHGRARPHRARRPDRAGAGDHAPRHRLHDGRRRQGRDVPQRRRHPDGVRRDDGAGRTGDDVRHGLELHVADAEHFLVAAAKAMEIDTLHQIDTGLDPVTAEREQWDDGNNTLALAPARRGRLRAQRRDQRPPRGRRHRGASGSPAPSSAPGAAARAA